MGVLLPQGLGEAVLGEGAAGRRAASGAGPSRVTSPFSSSPLPAGSKAPSRSVPGWGRRQCRPCRSHLRRGLQAMPLPAPPLPPPSPAPHLGAKLAAPAFTLRASLKLLSTPHPLRCSDSANRAQRCRSGSPPTGVPSQLNPFP